MTILKSFVVGLYSRQEVLGECQGYLGRLLHHVAEIASNLKWTDCLSRVRSQNILLTYFTDLFY